VSDRPPRPAATSDVSCVREGVLYQALVEAGFRDAHLANAAPQVWAGVLGEVPLFSRLDAGDLHRIAEQAQVAQVSAGQSLVREGLSAESFYVILTGSATVRRQGLGEVTLSRGEFFGEAALLDAEPRTATVTANKDMWVMKISRRLFFELVDQQPSIARALLAGLVARLRRLEAEAAQRAAEPR
jgi:CRP/FNR family transcriptional regulator, cyclic AMP receptor protein